MNRIEKLNKLQESFVSAFIENKGNLILEVATGVGKTYCALLCLFKLLELEWIKPDSKIFIFAETKDREEVFKEEAAKFIETHNKDLFSTFTRIEFKLYQSKVTEEREVDIYDEMKFGLTAKYHTSLLFPTPFKLGLDAQIPDDLYVFTEDIQEEIKYSDILIQSDEDTEAGKITKYIKKGQLASIIIPNRIKYTLDQGIEDGILSPYETVVINHSLGTKHKYCKLYTDKNKGDIYGSEEEWYRMRDRWRKDRGKNKHFRMMLSKQVIPAFLYSLKTKAIVCNKLLSLYPDRKFLIFSVRKDLLYDITDNVCEPENTSKLVQQFNEDKISVIATAQMIQQGRTLKGLTDIVILSYYKSSSSFLQRIGRGVRFVEGKTSRVWIIKTKNTFEDDYTNTEGKVISGWFSEMQKIYNSKKELVDTIDLRVRKEITSFDLFNNFKL